MKWHDLNKLENLLAEISSITERKNTLCWYFIGEVGTYILICAGQREYNGKEN